MEPCQYVYWQFKHAAENYVEFKQNVETETKTYSIAEMLVRLLFFNKLMLERPWC